MFSYERYEEGRRLLGFTHHIVRFQKLVNFISEIHNFKQHSVPVSLLCE